MFWSNGNGHFNKRQLHPPPHDVYKKMKEKKNEVMEEDLYKLLQIVYADYKENVSNHVPIKDRKWLVYLHKALTPHNSSHFYVDAVKRIPDYILSNALRHYPMPQTDRIFAVIDTSLFRAARIGVAISMQGISWSNALFGAKKSIQSNFFLSWEELSQKKLTIKKWKLVIDEKHSIDLGLVSYYLKPAELLELLNKLIEGYKEIHQEE